MKRLKYILALTIAVSVLASCKKNHDVLGTDVQPSEDLLNASFSDTSQIYAHTTTHSVITSYNDAYKYLGSNWDPYFGKTHVGLYVNANLENGLVGVTFPADANLVSSEIILAVPSLDYIGNNTLALNYQVHPVTSVLSNTVNHYSANDSLYSKNTVLGSYTGAYDVINGKLVVRIPIDNNFAKSILNNSAQYLVDNATFHNTYKGFYITTENTSSLSPSYQGVISKFNLDDDLSGFYLYYQKGTPSATKENIKFKFDFKGNDAVRFNTVKYDAPASGNLTLLNQILNVDTNTYGKINLFLKGLGGTRVKFYIPSIKSYADSFKVAVNRAELVFNVDPTFTTILGQYIPPQYLAILPLDSLGRETFTQDQLSATDFARYGGAYDSDKKRYVFNIARHVQAIMNGTRKNYGFYMVVANPDVSYAGRRDNYQERVILAGANNPTLKPKFNLSYIKFKNDK